MKRFISLRLNPLSGITILGWMILLVALWILGVTLDSDVLYWSFLLLSFPANGMYVFLMLTLVPISDLFVSVTSVGPWEPPWVGAVPAVVVVSFLQGFLVDSIRLWWISRRRTERKFEL